MTGTNRWCCLGVCGVLWSLFAMISVVTFPASALAQAAPGGLYVGYYYEDPLTNPEDPVPGALYLNLPTGDSSFSGIMFFTYLGCQNTSAGTISGSKFGASVAGRWSGAVDNTLQAGAFTGTYDATQRRYLGTYTVDGGKQLVSVPSCIRYYVAPDGTWELAPVGQSVPASFAVALAGSVASWPATQGAALSLVAVVDAGLAASGNVANAVRWQSLVFSPLTRVDLAAFGLTLGKNDVVTVATFDALGHRIAFGSKASGMASSPDNYQGLWWAAPAGSESGWGINFAHQGDVIFATWFTYDAGGKAWWLSMTATKSATNTYSGTLYTTHGPAFSAVPFDPSQVTRTAVGSATLTFTDASSAQFTYTVNGMTQNKALTREVFGTLPVCTFGAQSDLALATNYQDLWWAAPAGSESGWGINLTEQSNIIFGTWFTYDVDGTPLWLSVTATSTVPGTYTGTLYRTSGPAFDAVPFNPASVTRLPVGTATFTFSDGAHATFTYSVNGISQAKSITREIFVAPGTVCQ